jgi:hypothetical protein
LTADCQPVLFADTDAGVIGFSGARKRTKTLTTFTPVAANP